MEKEKSDFTNTFRGLLDEHLHEDSVFQLDSFKIWKLKWEKRVASIDGYKDVLGRVNPSVIPRNNLVEEALLAGSEGEDLQLFNSLLEKLEKPFDFCDSSKFQIPPVSEAGYKTFCGT
jgi:uncharacterized protein YdiU (UPF0061 family)